MEQARSTTHCSAEREKRGGQEEIITHQAKMKAIKLGTRARAGTVKQNSHTESADAGAKLKKNRSHLGVLG